jgi:hypothetical protein
LFLFFCTKSGSGSVNYEIAAGEFVEIYVWTRSNSGAAFAVVDYNDKKKTLQDKVEVKHEGSDDVSEKPTCVKITKERIAGPVHIKVKADSHAGRFSCHNYLVVYHFFPSPS